MAVELTVTVNGEQHAAVVDGRQTLADFLRRELGLTGTHLGCEHGVCGSCTVLVDGASARSCLMLAAQANGTEITTIEGLAVDGELTALQQAMRDGHGFQCGFCTPGFMITATELLREHRHPSEAQVREVISGNLCRCTGYQSIVDGIMRGAEQLDE
jgi:carbon-monoxide dehydrogenase small subunit